MNNQYLVAYDLGTSGIKCTLVEARTGVVRSCQVSYFPDTDSFPKTLNLQKNAKLKESCSSVPATE